MTVEFLSWSQYKQNGLESNFLADFTVSHVESSSFNMEVQL